MLLLNTGYWGWLETLCTAGMFLSWSTGKTPPRGPLERRELLWEQPSTAVDVSVQMHIGSHRRLRSQQTGQTGSTSAVLQYSSSVNIHRFVEKLFATYSVQIKTLTVWIELKEKIKHFSVTWLDPCGRVQTAFDWHLPDSYDLACTC